MFENESCLECLWRGENMCSGEPAVGRRKKKFDGLNARGGMYSQNVPSTSPLHPRMDKQTKE